MHKKIVVIDHWLCLIISIIYSITEVPKMCNQFAELWNSSTKLSPFITNTMRYSSFSVCSDWDLMSLICTMWCLLDLLYRVECFVAVIFCSHETLHNRITVVLDMRRSKWDNVKPVLKGLQVHLSTLTKRYSSVLLVSNFFVCYFFLTFGNMPAFALECQLLACTHCLSAVINACGHWSLCVCMVHQL